MDNICIEGECATKPRPFKTTRSLRQHQNKCHQDIPDEETALEGARKLKRKRDEEDEEERKRLRHEADLAMEAAAREPEPQPVGEKFPFQDAPA